MTDLASRLAEQRIVPVIRSPSWEAAVRTARACAQAGIDVIELTCTVPEVDRAIDTLRHDGLTVGLGTITMLSQLELAIEHGAEFAVSFGQPIGFVELALECGAIPVPGAYTPGEFLSCAVEGATLVKLYPGSLSRPGYIAELRTVLPKIQVMTTGGIRLGAGDIGRWLQAGALAVGIGGALGDASFLAADEITRRARAALAERPTREPGEPQATGPPG